LLCLLRCLPMSDVAEPFLDPDAPGTNFLQRIWHLTPALITEFIGTYFLVFTVYLSVCGSSVDGESNPLVQPALAIGTCLMVMIYMGGHISGGHYNPAVTLGVLLRGHIDLFKTSFYMVSQVAGGICAGLIGWSVTDCDIQLQPGSGYHDGAAFLVEVAYTFALVSVVLNVATTKSQHNNMFFGIAIGFTVVAGLYGAGGISGGVFNPAVGTGLLVARVANGGSAKYLWLYWVAPLTGSAMAALIFRVTNRKEFTIGVDAPQRQGFRNLDEQESDPEAVEINK